MTTKCNKKLLSLILSMMLIVAMAFSMTGCGGNDTKQPGAETETSDAAGTDKEQPDREPESGSDTVSDITILGEGSTVFTFTVTDGEGTETAFEIHTDKTTVGEALLELELIDGEDGAYGLYVKTVNGITADYDADGTYWAFYINGEMAMTGVDSTDVEEGAAYAFKVEK